MPPSLPLPSHTASSTVLLLVFFFFVVVVGFPLVGDLTHLMLMQCCRLQKCALVDAAVSHVASCLAVLVRLSLPACHFFPHLPVSAFFFFHFLCFLFFVFTPCCFSFCSLLVFNELLFIGAEPDERHARTCFVPRLSQRFFLLFFFFTQRVFRPNFDLLYLVQTLRHARQGR